jgi:DNA ligase-1
MRYKPMLAYPVSKKPIDYTDKVFIQPKLDGVRCLIQHDNSQVKAYSRTSKEWKNIEHILKELSPFFEYFPDVVLDGELYNHELKDDFEKIISLVRKTKPTDEDRQEASKMVQFHVYDVIFKDKDVPYERRRGFLGDYLFYGYKTVNVIDNQFIFSDKAAQKYHKINLKNGYEGSIVRLNKPYEQKRSHNLRKFKDFSDAEAYIVGYEEGKGKRVGTLGKFIMQDEDGNKFGCPPGKGYTYKQMKYMLNNIHKYMGQTATFTYFERTKAGSYRHPLFKTIRDYE